MANKTPQTQYDSPWKQMLQLYFQDFMLFFFPQAHAQIDWTRGFEFLDQELQQVVRDAELGKRLIDKLVKIYRLGGEESWLLIHAFIDWMLTLPLNLELEFKREVEQLEAQQRMQYVTSFERIARMEELVEAIKLGLELKFGPEALNLMPEISSLEDLELLRAVRNGIKTATSIDELRQIYQSYSTDTPPEN